MKRDLLILFGLAGWALALPHYGSEFVVSMALTCLMYAALSSSWGLFCGSTRYLSLATSAFFGIGAYTSALALEQAVLVGRHRARRRHRRRRRRGDGRGGAAPARHLFRGADLRHDRADPSRHHLLGEAGHRHRRPRADGRARARHDLPHGAGAGGRWRCSRRSWSGAAASAWRCPASVPTSSVRRRWASTRGWSRSAALRLTAAFAGAVGAAMSVRWTYIDPHTVFNPFIGFQTVLIALIGGAATLWGPLIAAVVFSLLAETLRLQVPQVYMMSLGAAADPVRAVPAGRAGLAALEHLRRCGATTSAAGGANSCAPRRRRARHERLPPARGARGHRPLRRPDRGGRRQRGLRARANWWASSAPTAPARRPSSTRCRA